MGQRIYVRVGDEEKGPYLLQQVNSMWLSGQLTADALYWFEGMEEWRPLAEFMAVDETSPDTPEEELPEEIFVEHAGTGRIVTNFPDGLL